jgi:hypothetical protein
MEAVRIETTVQTNGRVVLENLPFDEGDKVEVIVLETSDSKEETGPGDPYPLRGTVYKYEDPFGPATPVDDWEALK